MQDKKCTKLNGDGGVSGNWTFNYSPTNQHRVYLIKNSPETCFSPHERSE